MLDFPAATGVNHTFISDPHTWVFDGTTWVSADQVLPGFVGKTIGSGGSGAANTNNATVMAGAVGATGAIVVIEYISV